MQGQIIVTQTALATSTTESGDLVIPTYQYLQPGTIRCYAKSSAAAVLLNLFIQGTQVLRRASIPFTGTAGTLSTADNLFAEVNTLGGRIECTVVATTGTPTVDLMITHSGIPMVGGAIGGILRAIRGR
jgi:hypothetical protein